MRLSRDAVAGGGISPAPTSAASAHGTENPELGTHDTGRGRTPIFRIFTLPVSSSLETGGTRSGDAIVVGLTPPGSSQEAIIVVDAGYEGHGHDVVKLIRDQFGPDATVDLLVSTHADRDHLGGLVVVLEEFDVRELLIHQPRLHADSVSGFSNLDGIDKVLEVARRRKVTIVSPFTGLQRLGGSVTILGPTVNYYEALVAQHLAEQAAARENKSAAAASVSLAHPTPILGSTLTSPLPFLPVETLTDDVVTTAKNNMSVLTLLRVDGESMLLTGDAGIPALTAAASYYESKIGTFQQRPLDFVQAPHHGARRNVGPEILDRLLGHPYAGYGSPVAVISAASNDPDHPNPKVTNALKRRGCRVFTTEGNCLLHRSYDAPLPWGWTTATELPPFDESED